MFDGEIKIRETTSYIKKTPYKEITVSENQKVIDYMDKNGSNVKTEIHINDTLFQTNTYTINEKGLTSSTHQYWPKNQSNSLQFFEYKYDHKGNWIERIYYDEINNKKRYSKNKTIRNIYY